MSSLMRGGRHHNPMQTKNIKWAAVDGKDVESKLTSAQVLEEPDREESPESTRNDGSFEQHPFGSFERRGTASWPSAAIEFNDLAAISSTSVVLPRSRVTSSESGSYRREACESFDSTVTDFDYLTSPGAQAEMNAAYVDAVQSALPRAPNGFESHAQDSTVRPAFDMTGFFSNGSSSALNAQAAQLEFMAAQVMAQAYQAKAQALRRQSTLGQDAANVVPISGCSRTSLQMPCDLPMAALVSQSSFAPSSSLAPPKNESLSSTCATSTKRTNSERTTVMLRNLPNDYNRDMLVQLLNEHGFEACFNFLYLPMDLKRRAGLGYAFVNLETASDAQRIFATLQGFSDWQGICSTKVLEVAWGDPLQGLEAHVNRYRNSPVMHEDAPAEFRPLLFRDGQQVEFPPPTRKLRAPRLDFRGR